MPVITVKAPVKQLTPKAKLKDKDDCHSVSFDDKYKAKMALDTIKRAEEYKSDPKLMKAVQKEKQAQIKALNKV